MKLNILQNIKKKKIFSTGCKLQTYIGRSLYANVFELFFYDTRKNMKAGIKKFVSSKGYLQFGQEDLNVAGMVLEEEKETLYLNKEEGIEYRVFGTMFLNEEDFTMDICAHESVHAAMIHERNILKFLGLYDGNDSTGEAAEERLAYTIGEYVEVILNECVKNKLKIKLTDKVELTFKEKKEEK